MPVTSILDARDQIISLFTNGWNAQTPPVPLLLYDDKSEDLPKNGPYARITIAHNTGGQVTMATTGNRRFRRFGLVTIQIFSSANDGLSSADVFVKIANDIFEGASTGSDAIEFRNVRVNEIGEDGPWYQINVIAEFNYDRIR